MRLRFAIRDFPRRADPLWALCRAEETLHQFKYVGALLSSPHVRG